MSEETSINIGCPQGSVLSPFLFKIFINDIVNSDAYLDFTLFADDTSIYIGDHNLQNLYIRANSGLRNVQNWILANALALNLKKLFKFYFLGTCWW